MNNGQNIILKVHFNEQQEGVGQSSGTRYVGHVNQSDILNGSLVNSRYSYSQRVSVRLVSQGNNGNFKSTVNVGFTINSSGEVTSSREEVVTECQ